MMRIGRRHRPFFRINAVDGRTPRNGRILEKLGHYDPIEKNEEKQVVLNVERVKHWLELGAIPSDTVADILRKHGIENKHADKKAAKRAKAKAIARAKGKFFNKAEKIAAEKAATESTKVAEETKTAEIAKADDAEKVAEQAKTAEAAKVEEAEKAAEEAKVAETAKADEAEKAPKEAEVTEAAKADEAEKTAEVDKADETAKDAEADQPKADES